MSDVRDLVARTQGRALARIYREPKSAMQSGRARQAWLLDFAPGEAKQPDPLMGWYGSGDMHGQLRLRFESREAAIAYARAKGIAFEAEPEPAGAGPMKPKSYSDNFRFGRSENWSH